MSHLAIAILLATAVTAHADPTPAERALLDRGEISTTTGTVTAAFFGFGTGQALQGRWLERGWIFTLGDAGATALMVTGMTKVWSYDCNLGCQHRGEAVFIAGGLLALGLRIWQATDAYVVPARHNERVRELRRRFAVTPTGVAINF